ncbi:MAG: hypothetical protein V3W44_04185 [Dehalococcoidales bacterium]
MSEKKEPELWGTENDERLTHSKMGEAIEAELDNWDTDKLTGTLVMCGYVHEEMAGAASWSDHVLEHLLEDLDDNYGDPEGSIETTDNMKKAATVFVQAVLDEYTVWQCEVVDRKEIDVAEWVKENRPDWLEETKP